MIYFTFMNHVLETEMTKKNAFQYSRWTDDNIKKFEFI